MTTEITSTHEIAETEWDGESDEADVEADMTATIAPDDEAAIEFHVQMRSYTQREMESLIVEAAARMIVGQHTDNTTAKMIQDRCLELIQKKVNETLGRVTSEIIDQPMLPRFPGTKTSEPVTMREFLGLYGREYLTQKVDHRGRADDGYGSKAPALNGSHGSQSSKNSRTKSRRPRARRSTKSMTAPRRRTTS